jgi:hypothetical protein
VIADAHEHLEDAYESAEVDLSRTLADLASEDGFRRTELPPREIVYAVLENKRPFMNEDAVRLLFEVPSVARIELGVTPSLSIATRFVRERSTA